MVTLTPSRAVGSLSATISSARHVRPGLVFARPWPAGLWIRRNTIGCCLFPEVISTSVLFQILPLTIRQLMTARLKASFYQSWRGCPRDETPSYPLLRGKCYQSYPYFRLRNRNSMLLGAGIPRGGTLSWLQSTWRKHSAESLFS